MSSRVEQAAAIEWIPSDFFAPLCFAEAFENSLAPLELDLGCGDGAFLAAIAAQNPHRNFLGIERLLGRVRGACRKIAARGLTNARVLRVELPYAVEHLLPPDSIAGFHLMFPDPWPKRRHERRRLFTSEFLASLARALQRDGFVKIATDDVAYFQSIERVGSLSANFRIESLAGLTSGPASAFENRFVKCGLPIHRLLLRKFS